jgi:hypothetical protein
MIKISMRATDGKVWLPDALARKYSGAVKAWGWQYVFPSLVRSTGPRSEAIRCHHIQLVGTLYL